VSTVAKVARTKNFLRLRKMNHLKPSVQSHLKNVYGHLSLMFFISTVSSVLYFQDLIPDLLSQFSIYGTVISFFGFHWSSKKYFWSLSFAAFKGISLAPLLDYASIQAGSIVPVALASTCLVLISFTASVLLTPSTQYIKIGGFVGSLLTVTSLLSLVNLFVRSSSLFSLELYSGLVLFSLFLIHDTQSIIEKAEMGSRDFLLHSMELYSDVIAIFVRVVLILLRKEENESSKKKKKVY
jgi:FtsH-binding integral membrane protein